MIHPFDKANTKENSYREENYNFNISRAAL
jgi:hypothetical protein